MTTPVQTPADPVQSQPAPAVGLKRRLVRVGRWIYDLDRLQGTGKAPKTCTLDPWGKPKP